MAKVSATASMGIRIGVGHKKGFGSHDAVSPHHSITIERQVDDELTDEQIMYRGMQLHGQAEARVNKLISEELRKVREME